MILKCTCEHPYQDKKYGKFMRIMNKLTKTLDMFRCTVCGTTHQHRK